MTINKLPGLPDKYALSLLRKLHSDSATTSVVMITHRTNELIHDMMKEVENIIPRQQITYMLLGEHTQKSAEAIISKYDSTTDPKSRIITVGDPKSFHLSHFYPVLPIEYVVQQDHLPKRKIIDISNSRFPVFKEVNNHDDDNEKKTANISNNMKAVEKNFELRNHDKKAEKDSYHPTFVIQGNFGGKHSHRKNLLGTLNCLRAIEDKIMKGKTVLSNTKTTKNDAISEHKMLKTNSSANTRPNSVINYGNTTMKSIKRRLRKDTSAIEKRFLSEDNTEIGKHHKYNPAAQSSESLSIDLIGHLNGKVDVGTLRTGAVRFLSDLSSKNYYSSISQVREKSSSHFIYHFPEGLPHNPPFSHCIYDILDFLLPLIFIYVLPYRVKLY